MRHQRWLNQRIWKQGFTEEETLAEATAIHYMKKNEK